MRKRVVKKEAIPGIQSTIGYYVRIYNEKEISVLLTKRDRMDKMVQPLFGGRSK